jgi:aspartyl-tRNA(Asn)/glutamyl-tRNA(Gln) amidotransferase subunit A
VRPFATCAEIAASVREGRVSAISVVAACLERIERLNPVLHAFTAVTAERALARAAAVDAGDRAGPLAGVPFAVKNLIDVAGLPTVAGSKINREDAVASADAPLVRRLEAAGAILVGALNMGEYAYDFTGENAHDGASRNPHDVARMSGGSSGGSGSAVGGGLVPLALGSDTNGSIRVPSSFCGLFGLKPTFGRLTRAGSFPFVSSLDHLGPMARSVGDLAAAYDAMQGFDGDDPACVDRGVEAVSPVLESGVGGLRIVSADGYFRAGASGEALAVLDGVAAALGVGETVTIPQAQRARSAAYIITTTEGAALHLNRLRSRPGDFDADVRDRLIAGALVPGAAVVQAQKFRRWFRAQMLRLFEGADAILAPATPCTAPLVGQKTLVLDGAEVPLRPNIGIYTQPISFIGLPVVAVPVQTASGLPIGVQIITAPWREDVGLRIARELESGGMTRVADPVL